MIYLLDTNTCIRYINRYSEPIINRLQNLSPDDVAICDVVKFELYYGAYNSFQIERNLDTLRVFFEEFPSLPFDGNAASVCGYLRSQLKVKGTPIGAYDLQIAAIALANNLMLVTHNIREFKRVEGLKLADWEGE